MWPKTNAWEFSFPICWYVPAAFVYSKGTMPVINVALLEAPHNLDVLLRELNKRAQDTLKAMQGNAIFLHRRKSKLQSRGRGSSTPCERNGAREVAWKPRLPPALLGARSRVCTLTTCVEDLGTLLTQRGLSDATPGVAKWRLGQPHRLPLETELGGHLRPWRVCRLSHRSQRGGDSLSSGGQGNAHKPPTAMPVSWSWNLPIRPPTVHGGLLRGESLVFVQRAQMCF